MRKSEILKDCTGFGSGHECSGNESHIRTHPGRVGLSGPVSV